MPKPMTIIWYSIFDRREGMAIDAPCCASKYETDYAIGLLSPHYQMPVERWHGMNDLYTLCDLSLWRVIE